MLNTHAKELNYTKVILVFLCFLFLHINKTFAQQPNLEFSKLNALENFTTSAITSLAEDQVGYLWIGTEEGLFRFDGQNLVKYQHLENDRNCIPSNKIIKLFVDIEKNIWICTNDGLCKYNPEYDNFDQIIVASNLRGVGGGYYISSIAENKAGQIYISTDNSIYKYNKSQDLFSKVIEINSGKLNNFIFDDQDNIWIASSINGGLQFFDQKNQQLSSFLNDQKNNQSISNNEVFDVAFVMGNIWIATYGGGIDSYNIDTKSFKHYFSPAYYENYAKNIFVDSKNNIWISTLGSLKLYGPTFDNFYNYYYQEYNPKSLGKNLTGFYEDIQGNYWSLHASGGLNIVKNINKFAHFDTNKESSFYCSEKNITALAIDGSGSLWIGNYFNGVDVFNWKGQRVDRYFHKDNDPNSLGNGCIAAIFCDSKQQMWIGSNFGGLQKIDPATKNFETYINNPDDTLSIANNDVRSISEDKSGNLWIALQGKGVDYFDTKSKIFHHFNNKNNKLSNDYTFQVLTDSKDNLWVATAWGLSLLKRGEKTFSYFINNENDSSSINNNEIQSIYEDQKHNIWVGTSIGLNKYDSKTHSFLRYSTGLKSKNIVSILSDNKDNIWVGTKIGISKFDLKTQRFVNFDQSDGLLSEEFIVRSCIKDNTNSLFFGGSEGIDLFNADSILIVSKSPTVVLTDFKLFNKSINFKNDVSVIKKNISYANKIVLNYNDKSFTFLYQTIDLTIPHKISYSYKLNGFDKDWIYAKNKREANYTNLNPGKYTFRVKSKYENSDWSEKETSIELIIVPAWWMTIWFKIIVVLLVLIVPLTIIYWRVQLLRKQREKLEKLVIKRTNEIQSKNDQLRALNTTKDKLFSIIGHDLRSPFNTILGFQDLLLNDFYELSDTEKLGMIRQVHTTTNQVYDLVENLLNWSRVQTSNIKCHPVKLNLKKVIMEKLDLYRNIAVSKGISFNFELPDELIAFADVNLLETSLRNLASNAIKFTPIGGYILVKTSQQNEVIKISVIDSGTGMTHEQLESLFNSEKTQTKSGTDGEKGSGLGLILCKEFVEKNKGKITVESEPGKGSTFSFTVPATFQE